MAAPTRFRTVTVDGLSLFYRDAGPADAPSVLLLHGFPSSSRMWQPLIDRLCDRYRLVAPDYPGFGHSDAPPADTFDYTFDHIADVIDKFAETVGLKRYSPRRRARAAVGNAAGVLGRPSRPRTGAPRELLLPRPNSSTARRQEPEPGRYDPSFEVAEAEAYRRDVPNAEVHVIDAGHFPLDEAPDLVSGLTGRFLDALPVAWQS